jgi:hypothetical protein
MKAKPLLLRSRLLLAFQRFRVFRVLLAVLQREGHSF